MHKIVLSGAGDAGSKFITGEITSRVNAGNCRITLIVPEQYTFTCQKNLLSSIGPEKMTMVDVYSFTELGEKIIGKPAFYERRRLSDSAAAVLMSLTLAENKDNLKLYGRHAEHISAVKDFLALSSEFKQNGVTPEKIRQTAENTPEGLLKIKLEDIALILDAFDKKVEGSYFNPDDLLSELLYAAGLDDYFRGRTVFVDSFRGFTAPEYGVIERIIRTADDFFITLCADNTENFGDITDLFAKTKNTAGIISSLGSDNGIKFEYDTLPEQEYYRCPELAHLEKNLYRPVPETYEGRCDNILLCSATDIYLECEYIAAGIKKLIRSGKYRCRDIAVIAGNISDYEAPLNAAFEKYGISSFEDFRKSADASPVINLVSAALAAVSDNFAGDSIMRYLKTGLTGIPDIDISNVENYIYLWKISGRKWLSPWDKSVRGFEEIREKDREQTDKDLAKLNETRLKIIGPLSSLKSSLKGGVKGAEAVKALWNFIESIHLSDNLRKTAKELIACGENNTVAELDRTWNLLTGILDEINLLIESETVTAEKLSSVFDLIVSVQTVGSIPRGLDEVTMGSAERMRINALPVIFIAGANEGVFPPAVANSSLLSLNDRRRMEENGITLSACGEMLLADEKLIAYSSVCAPREKLFISCCSYGKDGAEMSPNEFYNAIKDMFPACKEISAAKLDPVFYAESDRAAFEQLAKSREGNLRETLFNYFGEKPEYEGRLLALNRAAGIRDFSIKDKNAALKLFTRKMMVSSSKVESYYSCPFMYFCKYGIKAMPRRKSELDASQMGTVTHYVLEKLISGTGREGLLKMTENEIKEKINLLMDEYLEKYLYSPDDIRFLYVYNRMKDSLYEIVKRIIEEFEQSEFVPVSFELPVGPGEEVEAYIPDGPSDNVSIIGKIDRVDTADSAGSTFIRIVDYKSKQKEFKLSDAVQGISMQMLIYLFALWKNGKNKFGENITPAGILYYNASTPIVSADIGETEQDKEKAREKAEKMTGVVLADEKVIHLMCRDDSRNILPASVNPSTGKIKGNALSLKEFEALKKKTDELICKMAENLQNGEISAVPSAPAENKLPCRYCDYRSVCSYEEGIPFRQRKSMKNEDVIKQLTEEGDGSGSKME